MKCKKIIFNCDGEDAVKLKKMYKLRLCVIDDTDSTTIVVFDRDATTMLKKSCYDILDLQEKNTDARNLPKEFEVLIDKTYLFKLECKNDYTSKFNQSFRVKKVCMDEKIIESFTDVEPKFVSFARVLLSFLVKLENPILLHSSLGNLVLVLMLSFPARNSVPRVVVTLC
ncbi:Nucleic acid-binding [Vigna unguiculata]|uniref:Nucleic acid-binding n=1 Tax=Vigna unguiculata TaxID=3917 RepID=A0A4D6L568_VIGUN|nr:Nucleic acid-binding [Vigna unguiculata]